MKFSISSVLFISVIALPMDSSVEGQFQQSASISQGKEKHLSIKDICITFCAVFKNVTKEKCKIF